ncbi:hypothetical protein ABT340_31785 [Streptosporangium sp. NPDC000239]
MIATAASAASSTGRPPFAGALASLALATHVAGVPREAAADSGRTL